MFSRRISTIRSQMVAVFILCSLLISMLIAAVCIRIIYATMERQAAAALMEVTGQIDSETQIMLDEANRLLRWGDVAVVADFFYGKGTRHREASAIVAAFQNLRTGQMIGKSVRNVYLLDTDGYGYNQRTGFIRMEGNERARQILNHLQQTPDELLYFDNGGEGTSIVIGAPIRQTATRNILGYMAIELQTAEIETILSNVTLGRSGSCFIMDSSGTPLLGVNAESETIAGQLMERHSQSLSSFSQTIGANLVTCRKVAQTGWYVVGYAPIHELMSEFYMMLGLIILVIVGTLALAITLYAYVSNRLTEPIQRLKNCMLQAADGNLDAIIEPVSRSEFSVVENQYNRMLSEIKALMSRNAEEQEKLKKAELRALQAQINPHFLYNTLDAVIWLVAAGDNDKAIEMIEQLSIFFRIGLSKGLDWISVREDIEHLYSYLYIQRVRYSDLLDFSVEVDESIMNCIMLKMTLQPIVENAIYHGIKHKKNGGRISVTGRMDESGCLVFEVSDTGVGMTPEICRQMQATFANNQEPFSAPTEGFGLFNVDRRIKLYCGEAYGLSICSELNAGTTVTVRMRPREAGKDNV